MSLYEPLGSSPAQFRLLKVLGLRDGVPDCELHVVSHTSTVEPLLYDALSYRWGDGEATMPIKLNGQESMTRLMLYQFLEQLVADNQDQLIFVDAVCINQSDTNERADQVRFMRDIYKLAERVILWIPLEPWEIRSLAAMETVLQQRQYLKSQLAKQFLSRTYWKYRVASWIIQVKDGRTTSRLRTDLKMAIEVFIMRDAFWSRLWIMQEVLLARQLYIRTGHTQYDETSFLATSHIGQAYASMSLFAYACPLVHDTYAAHINHDITSPDVVSHGLSVTIRKLRTLLSDELRAGRPFPFYLAIVLSSTQECCLLHDRVFGICGITKTSIVPDYDMPIGDLFVDSAAECIISWTLESPLLNDKLARKGLSFLTRGKTFPNVYLSVISYLALLCIFKLAVPDILAMLTIKELAICCGSDELQQGIPVFMMAWHRHLLDGKDTEVQNIYKHNKLAEEARLLAFREESERKFIDAKVNNALIKAPWTTRTGEPDERRFEDWAQHIRQRANAILARKADDV